MKYLTLPIIFLLVMCSPSNTSTSELSSSTALFPAKMSYTFDPMPEIDVLEGSGLVEPEVAKGARDTLGFSPSRIDSSWKVENFQVVTTENPVGVKFQIKGIRFELADNGDYKATLVLNSELEDILYPIKKTISLEDLQKSSQENPIDVIYGGKKSDKKSSYNWTLYSIFEGTFFLSSDLSSLSLVKGSLRFHFNYTSLGRRTARFPHTDEDAVKKKTYETYSLDDQKYSASLDNGIDLSSLSEDDADNI